MKLVDVSCPHCGAGVKITDNAKTVNCEYCNYDFIIDDEGTRVAHRIEDAEQLGYDLEAGRRKDISEQEGKKNLLRSGLCPHCGTAVFMDKAHLTEICYECHKEFNTEAANLFERANLLFMHNS
jgi:ribosomal protein S27AE